MALRISASAAANCLAIDFRKGAQPVALGRVGLQADDLGGSFCESGRVAPAEGRTRQGALGLDRIGTQAHRLHPFGFGTLQIARLVKRHPQLVVGLGVVGLILDHGLQRYGGILQISAADLHLAAINKRFVIVRAGFQEFIIELACLIETVLLDQKLNVIFLDLDIFGMLLVEGGVFGGGFVQVPGGAGRSHPACGSPRSCPESRV